MSNLEYELDSGAAHSRAMTEPRQKSAAGRWKKWVIPLALAVILLAAGYFLARHYIEEMRGQLLQIQSGSAELNRNVKQVHDLLGQQKERIEQLQNQFTSIESEVQAVKEELSLAGNSLNASDETKKALSQRIADLSKELDGLRKVIAKLEEAARVY